jgi:hypothetical protein
VAVVLLVSAAFVSAACGPSEEEKKLQRVTDLKIACLQGGGVWEVADREKMLAIATGTNSELLGKCVRR